MFGGKHDVGDAEDGIGAGGVDGNFIVVTFDVEGELCALGAPDPILLHDLDAVGPALEFIEIG